MSESITISIPAYNEEATLDKLVRQSREVLKSLTEDYEILLINDGSRDRTGTIADTLAKEDSRIRVIHHPVNWGFGRTLQEVFTKPSKEWVFFIPGDGQIPPEELRTLWPHRGQADFILGWRVDRQDPWMRRFTAGVYNLLISVVLGRRVHDVDSVALYRKSILRDILLTAQSVFLHAELCLKVCRKGARMKEVPIAHRSRQGGQAAGNKPGVIWQTCRELLSYVLSPKNHA